MYEKQVKVRQYDYNLAIFYFSQKFYKWIGRDEMLGYSVGMFNEMIRTSIGASQIKDLIDPQCAISNDSIGNSWAIKCKKEKKFSVDKISFWIRHGKLPGYVWLEVTIFPLFENGVLIGRKEISKWEKPLVVHFTDNPPCLKSDCPNYFQCQGKIKEGILLKKG